MSNINYECTYTNTEIIKGYLDIVRWLCETGGANKEENNIRGVNARSKGGWTPLSEPLTKCAVVIN